MKFTNDFFSATSTDPADELVQLIDSDSKENVNYRKVTHWYHNAVPMTFALCDGVIYRERQGEYYALASFLAGKPINIELFGAKGDAINNDSSAFQKAANFVNGLPIEPIGSTGNWSLEQQSVTLVGNSPLGYMIKETISFKKPVNFLVDKIFYRGESNITALNFQNSYKNTITTNISGSLGTNVSSDDFIGILLQGAQHCKMHLGASFFTKGIICEANDAPGLFPGFAWNEIQLKSMQSNLDSFVIRNKNNGWANVNRVIGGEFGSFSGLMNVASNNAKARSRTFIKFEKDEFSKGCNSWLFLNQAFEWKDEFAPYKTLCFDFSAEPCYGISISETRIETTDRDRIGIFHSNSDFSFETNQYYEMTDFTNERGIKYIGKDPIVLLDENLNGDVKKNGIVPDVDNPYTRPFSYVKNLEPFNESNGLFPATGYVNEFCQVFKINNPKTNLWVRWHRYAQFVLFDENKNIIINPGLLNEQIKLIDNKPENFWISSLTHPSVRIIKVGQETNGDYINNFSFIPQAKYVGIIQTPYDNARLKVMINRRDLGCIEKVKFLGIPEDTYAMTDDPSSSNLSGFNFNTGEKFYNLNTHKSSVIKESGVGVSLLGYTLDGVNGSRRFTVKTGDTAKLSLGTMFYINTVGGTVRFKIVEKEGNIITSNIPSPITINDGAITFPLCTYDTY